MRPGDVAIGWESVPHASPSIGRLYEQAVTASRLDPATVLVVRMTEMQVAVDYVDFQDPSWPVRTQHVTFGAMRDSVSRRPTISDVKFGVVGTPRRVLQLRRPAVGPTRPVQRAGHDALHVELFAADQHVLERGPRKGVDCGEGDIGQRDEAFEHLASARQVVVEQAASVQLQHIEGDECEPLGSRRAETIPANG